LEKAYLPTLHPNYNFISTSTPAERSNFMRVSTVACVGSIMSISLLCVLISNNVNKPFMCPDLKLLPRLFIDMG